jgi:2-methylisocitrate lyase-like PEP mutase family enzyme
MNQEEKAKRFAQLHVKGTPLLLYNAWDAGSARSILEAGAKAIATSSWSVAAAQGYQDGEAIPIELAEEIVGVSRLASMPLSPWISRAAIAKTTSSLPTTFRALSTWA